MRQCGTALPSPRVSTVSEVSDLQPSRRTEKAAGLRPPEKSSSRNPGSLDLLSLSLTVSVLQRYLSAESHVVLDSSVS